MDKEMKLFHGGCHGCTMQYKKGTEYCSGCCYFDANWSLPDLNNSHSKETKDLPIKEQVKKYWGENSHLKNGETEDEWYERRKDEINRFRSGG